MRKAALEVKECEDKTTCEGCYYEEIRKKLLSEYQKLTDDGYFCSKCYTCKRHTLNLPDNYSAK